jgi:hypothetical protein
MLGVEERGTMKRFLSVVLALSVCWAGGALGDELIVNGSFETPVIGNCVQGGGWDYCPSDDVDGWTVEWLSPAGQEGNLEFQNSAVNLGGPFLGDQYVEMDSHGCPNAPNCNVRIYQDVFTCAGSYAVSYAWRTRPNVGDSSMHLRALLDGVVIGDHDDLAPWTSVAYDADFPMIGAHTLEFEEIGTGDQLGSFLDAVSFEGANAELPNACVAINLKLGSDPNSVNTCSGGTTPVTIWGSATFDVTWIDPGMLSLASSQVKTVGKSGKSLCSIEDVGGPDDTYFDNWNPTPDGYPDMTCHFLTFDLNVDDSSTEMDLGLTVCDGGYDYGCGGDDPIISASDAVNIVKDC